MLSNFQYVDRLTFVRQFVRTSDLDLDSFTEFLVHQQRRAMTFAQQVST